MRFKLFAWSISCSNCTTGWAGQDRLFRVPRTFSARFCDLWSEHLTIWHVLHHSLPEGLITAPLVFLFSGAKPHKKNRNTFTTKIDGKKVKKSVRKTDLMYIIVLSWLCIGYRIHVISLDVNRIGRFLGFRYLGHASKIVHTEYQRHQLSGFRINLSVDSWREIYVFSLSRRNHIGFKK